MIGVDQRDAEVVADLSTPTGRATMVDAVTEHSGGRLEGLVACAGVSGRTSPADLVVRLDYFGAVATLDGLNPLLVESGHAAAVAISSNTAFTWPDVDEAGRALLLAGDEEGAAAHPWGSAITAYASSKRALARWVRAQSVTDSWVGSGVRLNAVAPGLIVTGMTEDHLDDLLATPGYPRPTSEPGRPEEVAGLVAFLLAEAGRYVVGSFLVMDGGTDAALRPDL